MGRPSSFPLPPLCLPSTFPPSPLCPPSVSPSISRGKARSPHRLPYMAGAPLWPICTALRSTPLFGSSPIWEVNLQTRTWSSAWPICADGGHFSSGQLADGERAAPPVPHPVPTFLTWQVHGEHHRDRGHGGAGIFDYRCLHPRRGAGHP